MPDRSSELYYEACRLMPGGVNSPVRACQNVDSLPLFIDRASGSHLFDVDGCEYIDYVLSWGPMLLGHADPAVTQALLEAVPKGTSYGAPCPGEVELAAAVIAAVPGMEMARMVNSGTEATMSALRLARAVTGRDKLVKFIGCYHGHSDSFLAAAGSGVATLSIPGTPGVPDHVVKDTLLAPYNDIDAVEELFREHGKEIAAVIVEPVAANMGLVLPVPGFLDSLRKLCDTFGALLIFDEVITGFRLAYGGAQARFGIDPDLATFGKIIGGGLPVGCFGGKRKYMEQVAPSGDVYQAGTLSGNPLAMAAGIATLKRLRTENYESLQDRTAKFAANLAAVLAAKNLPVQVPTIASMFSVFFNENPVHNFSEASASDARLYTKFYKQMRERGIYLAPSPFETGMISFAHSEADFQKTLEAASAAKF
ncbi:MAG: glutamate-1-semialdehyde 2,1-aminomutase [Desulfovibrio sp.]|nr:glutamate-1-semialdehyde 2,1-aminomutase [Desulfovibrio sp.]